MTPSPERAQGHPHGPSLLAGALRVLLKDMRQEYARLLEAPDHVEHVLQQGADKARAMTVPYMAEIREAIGIRSLASLD